MESVPYSVVVIYLMEMIFEREFISPLTTDYWLSSEYRIISPVAGPRWPRGFQGVKVPRLRDNGTGWW